jgi:hypothetical protein
LAVNGKSNPLTRREALAAVAAIASYGLVSGEALAQSDPLPSWYNGAAKVLLRQIAILNYVNPF